MALRAYAQARTQSARHLEIAHPASVNPHSNKCNVYNVQGRRNLHRLKYSWGCVGDGPRRVLGNVLDK